MTDDPTPEPIHQCAKCPWRKDVDPHDIPHGYCPTKHAALKSTIADDGPIGLGTILSGMLPMMACHESYKGEEKPCVGWMSHQLGAGNNIGLRLWARHGLRGKKLVLHGKQHAEFKDTLPKKKRRKSRAR